MPKTDRKKVSVSLSPEYKIWKAVGSELSRPVLTGVYLDPKGYMVACDSFLLAVVPCKIQGKLEKGVIIPTSVLTTASKSRPRHSDLLFFIEPGDNGLLISSAFGDGQMMSKPIDGTYPTWRRVIPPLSAMMVNTKQISYNPKLLLRLSESIGITVPVVLCCKNVNGQQGLAVVLGLDGAFGLVMSMFSPAVDRSALVRIARLRVKPPIEDTPIEDIPEDVPIEDTPEDTPVELG